MLKQNRSIAVATLCAFFAVSFSRTVGAQEKNGGILPPQTKYAGLSYGEWTAAWWQWALGIPEAINPVEDTTGEFCAVDQSGPVWFMGSSFGNSIERSCTIPAGKALFLPVFPWIFGAGVGDCSGPDCVVDTLRASAAAAAESATVLEVTIDCLPVQNVRDYRATSPVPFSVTFPDGAVFGLPAGTTYPQVTDGYWLMLAPLDVGSHTIRVHVVSSLGADFQVDYHLTIVAGKK